MASYNSEKGPTIKGPAPAPPAPAQPNARRRKISSSAPFRLNSVTYSAKKSWLHDASSSADRSRSKGSGCILASVLIRSPLSRVGAILKQGFFLAPTRAISYVTFRGDRDHVCGSAFCNSPAPTPARPRMWRWFFTICGLPTNSSASPSGPVSSLSSFNSCALRSD